ncbi:acyltransferase [Legionella waltersii]|uniref:Chloramphenicol acetyltransferase n=1 Tax=Legionella waltersii TaxID=66969 RepID=A0A0W1ANB4_9GAMM|nr:acyltransferase [Legionella waltersii]KTD82744.1 chloramphenicol acetyltransferase [Legionella waltersii]SNV01048.1 acetyltransferase [Legionella waltersii]
MPKKIKSARYTVIFFSIYSYVSNLLFILIDLIPQFLRQPLFYLVFKKYGKQSMIDYKCYFRYPWRISIGHQVAINRGCQFFPSMRSYEGWIIIEDNAVLGPYVKVFSAGHDYSDLTLPDTSAPVVIGKYTWIGGNSTILPGVKIGEGAIIGAGSVVARDIPAYSVAVGIPAKVIKMRECGQAPKEIADNLRS